MKNRWLTNLIPTCLVVGPFALALETPWSYLGSIMLMVGLVWLTARLNDVMTRLDKLEQT